MEWLDSFWSGIADFFTQIWKHIADFFQGIF